MRKSSNIYKNKLPDSVAKKKFSPLYKIINLKIFPNS